jgi:hypothetical protein
MPNVHDMPHNQKPISKCAHCGTEIVLYVATRKYCGNNCRQKAFQRRQSKQTR